jgi:drug/metabolite transporter (DMT)-like permease
LKKAFIQLHIAVFLAGFTGILGRLITLNEGLIVWWRLLISAVTMWILFLPAGAIKYANVSVALVCFPSVGFFTALLEPILLKTVYKPVELLLGLFVIAGIFIIFHFDTHYKTGIIIGVISAILGAVFPICNRQLMQRMNAETLMTYELTGGFLALSLFIPFYLEKFPGTHRIPVFSDWLWLLFLSWICSVWAFQLSANALKKIPAFTVNLTYNLEPVYGIILAFVIYRENQDLGKSFYIGLLFILIAVALQTVRVWKKRREA